MTATEGMRRRPVHPNTHGGGGSKGPRTTYFSAPPNGQTQGHKTECEAQLANLPSCPTSRSVQGLTAP